jgi:hypothetical protein
VLDSVQLMPGTRVVIAVDGDAVTLDVSRGQPLAVPIHADMRIVSELADVAPRIGARSPVEIYLARLSPADRMVRVTTDDGGFVLVVRPTPDAALGFFDDARPKPVDSVRFVDEAFGAITSSSVADGTLIYPDYPQVPSLRLAANEFVSLRETNEMMLRSLQLDAQVQAVRVVLDGNFAQGSVGAADTGAAAERLVRAVDPRLTVYEVIRHGPRWNLLAIVVVWAMGTTWSAYERWKSLGK